MNTEITEIFHFDATDSAQSDNDEMNIAAFLDHPFALSCYFDKHFMPGWT